MKSKGKLFLCLLLGFFLAACGGGGGGGGNGGGGDGGNGVGAKKLLVRIVTEGEGERAFQYDDRNRLIGDSALGAGNKIEYQGNDVCPSLVTNGNSTFAPYDRYQYGKDDLLGVSTKYYQTQSLDQNKNPNAPDSFARHYLNSDDREIVRGSYSVSSNYFSWHHPSVYPYDEHGNLLGWTRIRSGGHGLLVMVTAEYTYDDKKGPASGMVTPLWWFQNGSDDFSDNFLANPNNPLSYTVTSANSYDHANNTGNVISAVTETYNYTYDQDGYPTVVDVTKTSRDNQGIEQTTHYRKTFEYVLPH
jgi:hypothetical protein